jgi:3-oxoacyl-[acyl-carrier protein] reductase
MSKVALITGSARGIGRGIAESLSNQGFDIVIADICSEEAAGEAVASCSQNGSRAIFVQTDISNAQSRQNLIAAIKKDMGQLDILVNNAGVAPNVRTDILEASEDSFDRLMNINLKGPYFLTQAVANWMIEQKKADAAICPIIVNIASISSYTSSPARGEYCISKAGVSMMTSLYADRLAEYGINVYEIRPGIIKTDMTSAVAAKYDKLIAEGITPIKRWGYPGDIAKAVSAMAAGLLPFSTGEVINVDGGFHMHRL